MKQTKKSSQSTEQNYFDSFYEDLERNSASNSDYQETSDTGGLSQENVHKITEDIFNPMPPPDTDS